uniref:Glycosyltransferase n=1 Tax=viral metagenome TaxID=1070528 RepID=A0A6C0BQG4_9ZZZZ
MCLQFTKQCNMSYEWIKKLPQYVHQIWFDFNDTSVFTHDHCKLVSHTQSMALNYGFKYKLWSLCDAEDFIKKKYPYYYNFFKSPITFNIIKCDFFRLLLMYHFGGIYIDIDFYVIKSFNDLFTDPDILFYDIDNSIVEDKNNCKILMFEEWYNSSNLDDKYSIEGSFHNGILCSVSKRESFWIEICNHIQIYGKNVKNTHDVWKVSGTNKLKNMFIQNNDKKHFFYCKYYVACPFRCVSIATEEIMECKSPNDKPINSSESYWMSYTLSFLENLHDVRLFFDSSAVVCIDIPSGSLWLNKV